MSHRVNSLIFRKLIIKLQIFLMQRIKVSGQPSTCSCRTLENTKQAVGAAAAGGAAELQNRVEDVAAAEGRLL